MFLANHVDDVILKFEVHLLPNRNRVERRKQYSTPRSAEEVASRSCFSGFFESQIFLRTCGWWRKKDVRGIISSDYSANDPSPRQYAAFSLESHTCLNSSGKWIYCTSSATSFYCVSCNYPAIKEVSLFLKHESVSQKIYVSFRGGGKLFLGFGYSGKFYVPSVLESSSNQTLKRRSQLLKVIYIIAIYHGLPISLTVIAGRPSDGCWNNVSQFPSGIGVSSYR